MDVVIGIDPRNSSHHSSRSTIARSNSRSCLFMRHERTCSGCRLGPSRSNHGRGRSRARTVSAICCPGSSSLPVGRTRLGGWGGQRVPCAAAASNTSPRSCNPSCSAASDSPRRSRSDCCRRRTNWHPVELPALRVRWASCLVTSNPARHPHRSQTPPEQTHVESSESVSPTYVRPPLLTSAERTSTGPPKGVPTRTERMPLTGPTTYLAVDRPFTEIGMGYSVAGSR